MREIAVRAVVAGVVAALGLTGAPMLTGVASAAEAPVSASSRYAVQAIRATNQQRRDADAVRLRRSACLQRYAIAQAERMAMQRRMFHQKLPGLLRGCGLTLVGENVAAGYSTGQQVVVSGWMHSAPHRANILDQRYRLVAVAARQDSAGRWYACQLFGRS